MGPDRVELVSQLTFDSASTKVPSGFSKELGEPGGFVLEKTSSTSDLYTIEVDAPMEDSAIMMWASIYDNGHSETFLWYAALHGGGVQVYKISQGQGRYESDGQFFPR